MTDDQVTITTQARAIVALDDELQAVLVRIAAEHRRHAAEVSRHEAAIAQLHQIGRGLEAAISKLGAVRCA